MKGFSIKRLVRKITHKDFNLNNSFTFMGVEVHCQSGTVDFVAILSKDLFNFSFDFWTKRLVIDYFESDTMKNALIEELKSLYDKIEIVDYTKVI